MEIDIKTELINAFNDGVRTGRAIGINEALKSVEKQVDGMYKARVIDAWGVHLAELVCRTAREELLNEAEKK